MSDDDNRGGRGRPASWWDVEPVDPTTPGANWHLTQQLEQVWPMLVHGAFLWYGRTFRPEWVERRRQWIDQLEDGELVPADAIYACANTCVAQYLARVDEVYVAVDTRGYPSLGTAIRAQQHPAA